MSSLGKSASIRTSVQLLPRLQDIPKPVCREIHELDGVLPSSSPPSKCTGVAEAVKCAVHRKSPEPCVGEVPPRSNSPRFTKPNVLSHEIPAQCPSGNSVVRCRCPCADCRSDFAHPDCVTARYEHLQHTTPRTVRSPEPDVGCASGVSTSLPIGKELGAIPKHHDGSLPVRNGAVIENGKTQCPAAKSAVHDQADCNVGSAKLPEIATKTSSSSSSSLNAVVTAGKPTSLDVVQRYAIGKYAVAAKEVGTDSSSSSPDIDAVLTKTLTSSRCDPLSPQEMEVYLSSLYRRHTRKARSISHSSGRCDDSDGKLELMSVYEADAESSFKTLVSKGKGPLAEMEAFSSKNAGYYTPDTGRLGPIEAKLKLAEILRCEIPKLDTCNGRTVCSETNCTEPAEDRHIIANSCANGTTCLKSNQEDNDSVFDDAIALPVCVTNRGPSRKLFHDDPSDQPLFVVGHEDAGNDTLCTNGELSAIGSAASEQASRPVLSEAMPSNTSFHKSVSCPNKKAFNTSVSGFQKAGSLLKNVMKKEMHSTSVSGVHIHLYVDLVQ